MRTKYIVSLSIAQALVSKGYRVVEIKSSSRQEGRLVFGFEDTAELRKDFGLIVNK
ncbi:hypothetical protein MPH47_12095 [Psychrobacillus psychrodurans]|uniref:hypothetical protein n=1 Tax=Psychrobacillus psychrodurans TaxID=126157 RepID=UPI001F4EABED|nr:hypothetical protein [Psychrobacillus psychrodurans]MCK1997956.1 hypothetical protein [Psychrobacillus psychrodurans]